MMCEVHMETCKMLQLGSKSADQVIVISLLVPNNKIRVSLNFTSIVVTLWCDRTSNSISNSSDS